MPVPIPQLPGVEHCFVELPSGRIHVAEAGEGEPIVLLHGWPQHWWSWRHHIGPLAQSRRVICPDLRGLGWSEDRSGDFSKDALADDVLAVLDELGHDRVALVGHDWGAFVGFLLTLRVPERFSGFVALSMPHPWVRRDLSPALVLQLAQLWYQVVMASPVLGPSLVRSGRFPAGVLKGARAQGRWTDEELATYVDVLAEPEGVRASQAYYRTFLLRELPGLIAGRLSRQHLSVPTRLLVGGEDQIAKYIDLSGHEDHTDDMRVERVPGAGHFLPEERTELVLERIREFLLA